MRVNNFSMTVATINGSGSQSANNILMRSIFRMGIPVSGKNLFPSNIAGLPTWFSIRVSDQGFVAREALSDIVVAMNKDTVLDDRALVKPDGLFIYNSSLKVESELLSGLKNVIAVDFNELAKDVSPSIQLKKLLVNMVYVGLLAEILQIPESALSETIEHQFKGKESVYTINKKAVEVGRNYFKEQLSNQSFPYKVEKRDLNKNKILIDGNTSGALGFVYGGCSFASWYPITPSSSLAESFEMYCNELRTQKNGEKNFAMVQAEDELGAISMVAGAGWAGARAMTTTSGPGISLMSEAIGLMYFAEIPGVVWDVQRMGPSTGLPTRTSQGDLIAAARSSHGDTRHPLLLPATPKECFEFASLALDLSERAQTPVFVMSDLDLGMNFWMSEPFEYPTEKFDRGKVLYKEDLDKIGKFARYADVDGDGIPYRTLPGTHHDLSAYFTRGTGHTPEGKYSEKSDNYQALMNRLDRKWETLKTLVPEPEIKLNPQAKVGVIYFGSTDLVIEELQVLLKNSTAKSKLDYSKLSFMRLKAYPFTALVREFMAQHEKLIVIEQNQHGQMTELLRSEFPDLAPRIFVETNCDGLPLCPQILSNRLLERNFHVG